MFFGGSCRGGRTLGTHVPYGYRGLRSVVFRLGTEPDIVAAFGSSKRFPLAVSGLAGPHFATGRRSNTNSRFLVSAGFMAGQSQPGVLVMSLSDRPSLSASNNYTTSSNPVFIDVSVL